MRPVRTLVLALALFCAGSSLSVSTVSAQAPSPNTPPAPAAQPQKQSEQDLFLAAAKKAGLDSKRVQGYIGALNKRKDKYGLKQDQIDTAFAELRQVLEAVNPQASPFTADQRKGLVETALHNIALTMEIDQGYHPTCNVTTVEVYIASKHPDLYAKLIRQVSLEQKYTCANGKTATPPLKALLPGRDEKAYNLDKPNIDKRNHASQVVQMTMVNATYELGYIKRNGRACSDYRYILGPVRTQPIANGWIDLGEAVLIDGSGNHVIENGEVKTDPGFTVDDNRQASELILGYKMPYLDGPSQEIHTYPDGSVVTMPWKYDLPTKDRLLQLKKDGKLPLGVATLGGAHVQTIHDVVVDKNGQCWVLIDNQHGASGDGWVTLEDLHRAQQERSFELKPTRKPADVPQ